jgi:hypothetical protein
MVRRSGVRRCLRWLRRLGWTPPGGPRTSEVEAAERTTRSTSGGSAQWRWTGFSPDPVGQRLPSPVVIHASRACEPPPADDTPAA